MPRDVFPHEDDRALIAAFLAGAPPVPPSGYLAMSRSELRASGYTIAWFDTAGALCAKLPSTLATHYCRRTINEIMRQLGVPERELTVEHGEWSEHKEGLPDIREVLYFFDGVPVRPEAPFVLAGALSMQAHQASATTVGSTP